MVLFRQYVGWLPVLVGVCLQPTAFADKLENVTYLENEAEGVTGLNFDTIIETYIGPIPADSKGSGVSQLESGNNVTSDPSLELPPSTKISLSRIRDLRSVGAFTLAESLLVAGLPSRAGKSDLFDWHRELWEVREENDRRDLLIESLLVLAKAVEGDQQLEVLERLVRVQQKNGDFLVARSGLRDLMLMSNGDPVRTARLRRILIRNYLESGLLADAEAASLRYQNEYLPDDTEWNLLRGQILIENRKPSKAVTQLVGLQDQKAKLMLILARLHEGSLQPSSVIEHLESDVEFALLTPEVNSLRTAIVAEAAAFAKQLEIRVRILENLLASGVNKIPMLPDATPDQLLKEYRELAKIAGNEAHLLLGNDLDWIQHAEAISSEQPVIARAVYALLTQNGGSALTVDAAHRGLIDLLVKEELYPLVLVLYGDSAPLGLLPNLGEDLSLRLSMKALDQGDYGIAANVVSYMKQSPKGMTEWLWGLQVARLMIFAGKPETGADRLLQILEDANELDEGQMDELLQVAFDLQAISRDDLALNVFQAAGPFANSVRQKRELLFWMGESQIGEGRFVQGADLFLQSSEVAGQKMDMWGQSARFRAAEALVDAGLLKDAFNVYHSLLIESNDKNRQLQLRQKLQNLNLLEAVQSH